MQHEFNHARPTPWWGPRELPLGQGKPGTTLTSASDLSTNAEDFSSCRSPTTEVEGEPLRVSGRPTLRGSTAGQYSPALWGFCTPPSHTFGGPCQPSVRQRHPKQVEKKLCQQSGFIYSYIPSYTFIYLQIALYTFIYPHIHQNIEY